MGRDRHRGRRLVRHGARVVAVDRSAAMLALAQKRVAGRAQGRTQCGRMAGRDASAMLAAEHDGPTMFARIGTMRVLQRHETKPAATPRRQRAPKLTGSCDETDPCLSEDDAGQAARKTFSRLGGAADNPRALPSSQNMD